MERKSIAGYRRSITSVYHSGLPFALLFLATIIFFARLFYPESSIFMIPDFGESDVLHLNLPFKAILSESLKNNKWPVWTPLVSLGFPILAEGQIGTFYLPNLLLFRFLPPVTAYNLNLALSYFIAATGMYLLCGKLKLSKISSVFAAMVFAFSGFFSVHLNHFNLIQAASLLPLIIWAFTLLGQKNNLLASVFFSFLVSQQIFTGHFFIVFITLVTVVTFFFKEFMKKKKLGLWLLNLFLILTFSAIQLLPTIELWRFSERQGGLGFETVTSYPFPFKHLLSFINPYYFGSPKDASYPIFSSDWGIFWENTGYIGILPLVFALASIYFIKEKLLLRLWLLLGLSLLLVTGKNSPLYFIFSFPLFNLFRVPSKYLLITVFSLSLLSGFTFDKIISKRRKIILVFLVFLFFAAAWLDEYRFSYDYPPLGKTSNWLTEPETLKILPEKQLRIASIGSSSLWNSVFLKKGWTDMEPYIYFRNTLYPNYNAVFSLPSPDINTGGLIPRRSALYQAMIRHIEIDEEMKIATPSAISRNALNLAGVKYLISPYGISGMKVKKLGEVNYENGENIPPLAIYENEESRKRSFVSFKSRIVTTKEEAIEVFSSPEFSADNTVLVEDDDMVINNNNKVTASSEIVFQSDDFVELKTSSTNQGILVLSDTNYPGWKVFVDGLPAPLKYVNLAMKGILLPKGEHSVTFKFNPKSFEIGKIITVVSLAITALVVFLARVFYSRKASGTPVL